MGLFDKITTRFMGQRNDDDMPDDGGYVPIGTADEPELRQKIIVRPFMIEDFEDIKPILECMREGHTIALVNIRPLKEKDLVELKRAINKLKKTTDAIDGEIAGFGDDYLVVTPSFAQIYKTKQTKEVHEEPEVEQQAPPARPRR
ncbi:MAG: cell division protein SepF [Nanoarchaeota archaeon]